jgi:hypothetical protein
MVHGNILKDAWKYILIYINHLYKQNLFPSALFEFEDCVDSTDRMESFGKTDWKEDLLGLTGWIG